MTPISATEKQAPIPHKKLARPIRLNLVLVETVYPEAETSETTVPLSPNSTISGSSQTGSRGPGILNTV